jgi:hypothetical protein
MPAVGFDPLLSGSLQKTYHVDAFEQEGLAYDDNGNLTFQCDTHYKPVLPHLQTKARRDKGLHIPR